MLVANMFNLPTVAVMSATTFAVLASAQGVLPDSQVPNVGGGVWKANDPQLANYTFKFLPPFATDYQGYYKWTANNNTVALQNATAIVSPLGLTMIGGANATNTKYSFFEVSEGKPKKISNPKCHGHSESGSDESKNCGTWKFKKILHVIFENEVYSWTMNDMWWKLLATRGKLLTNSHGVTHPSFSNYVSLVAGDYFGIENQDWYNINATTIYDLLDAKGLSYATYAEWYTPAATARGPHDCNNELFMGPLYNTYPQWNGPVYRRVDVPPLLISTYTSSYTRCSKIYNATAQFDKDVKSHKLPPYSFYVPDMLHNGHDPTPDEDYAHQATSAGIWF